LKRKDLCIRENDDDIPGGADNEAVLIEIRVVGGNRGGEPSGVECDLGILVLRCKLLRKVSGSEIAEVNDIDQIRDKKKCEGENQNNSSTLAAKTVL
jgi:hypothetical protein